MNKYIYINHLYYTSAWERQVRTNKESRCKADGNKCCDPISFRSGGQVNNALLIIYVKEVKTFLKLISEKILCKTAFRSTNNKYSK